MLAVAFAWGDEQLVDMFLDYFAVGVALGMRFSAINTGRVAPMRDGAVKVPAAGV